MSLPEKSMLVILLDKDNFKEYKEYVNHEYLKETFRELSFIYKALFSLHEKVEGSITLDELQAFFWATYKDADKTIYGKIFESLAEIDIDNTVGKEVVNIIKSRDKTLKLSELSYKVANGVSTVQELYDFFHKEFDKVDHEQEDSLSEVTTDLEEIIDQTYKDTGLRWRLNCLNKSLGSLRSGDFGFIFARPETGKTTFLASEITAMLGDSDKPIIWFNNEEQGAKVMLRIYQAYFGVELDKLLASSAKYKQAFLEQTQGRFKLFDSATIGRRDVEAIVSKYNPKLVIYDQIDKIKGFANDRDDLRLGAIYQWARELAKGSHAAIGVSQADGHAEGVRYLTMEHVANAKTSKQAEADFILGIGKVHDPVQEQIRFINISKNKLFGDKDSIPDLRHGRFEVLIKPEIARYEDIIKFN